MLISKTAEGRSEQRALRKITSTFLKRQIFISLFYKDYKHKKDCILKSEPFRRSTKQDFNILVLVNIVDPKTSLRAGIEFGNWKKPLEEMGSHERNKAAIKCWMSINLLHNERRQWLNNEYDRLYSCRVGGTRPKRWDA